MNREILNITMYSIIFFLGIIIGRLLNSCIYLILKDKKVINRFLCYKYYVIEISNGLLYLLVFLINGFNIESVIFSLFSSALISITIIDWITYEIPANINIFIFILGSIRVVLDIYNFSNYLLGFFLVSTLLLILYLVTKGRAIGGGDIKLMAVAGLLLGWQLIILAFFIGCILGSLIHIIRMKLSGVDNIFAMGPYLSAGILISMLWGKNIINWYLNIP